MSAKQHIAFASVKPRCRVQANAPAAPALRRPFGGVNGQKADAVAALHSPAHELHAYDDGIDPSSEGPSLAYEGALNRLAERARGGYSEDEIPFARLFLIAGGIAVFVELGWNENMWCGDGRQKIFEASLSGSCPMRFRSNDASR